MIEVAIVEDNREIREGLRQLIGGSFGFHCIETYPNAELALQHIPFTKPQVVLMDINLPGINGIECIKLLKSQSPNTLFIISTVYEDDEMIFESLKAGAMGYLLKKTEPSKILEAIIDVCKGGSPMSMEIARKVISSFHPKNELDLPEILTAKEKEILKALSKGLRYKEIASDLSINIETVRTHARNIYEKLQVQSRTEALNKVYRHT
ncbi:MAG: response regulator transcription factor [Flavisolibacter sp.]